MIQNCNTRKEQSTKDKTIKSYKDFFGRPNQFRVINKISIPLDKSLSLRPCDYITLFLSAMRTENEKQMLNWAELSEKHWVNKKEADSPEAIKRMNKNQAWLVNGYVKEAKIKIPLALIKIIIAYFSVAPIFPDTLWAIPYPTCTPSWGGSWNTDLKWKIEDGDSLRIHDHKNNLNGKYGEYGRYRSRIDMGRGKLRRAWSPHHVPLPPSPFN